MKREQHQSEYIVFFDECGDHSLTKIDNDFPIFVLSTILVKRDYYYETIIPEITKFKLKYWNHEGINLHSREIRKSFNKFNFLLIPKLKESFINDINKLLEKFEFKLFISGIKKIDLISRYGPSAQNPYDLALKYTLERISHFTINNNITRLPFVAESRGKKEDNNLERVFYKIMKSGTEYMSSYRFKKLDTNLEFCKKNNNIVGLQLADLCGYPCSRHVLKPKQKNRAYEIIKNKIYNNEGVLGWKIFP